MLVLSRKNQESVIVGCHKGFQHVLTVTVVEIDHGSVKLGFEINKDVPVHRLEVWDRIRANGREDHSVAQIAASDL